MFGFNDAKPGSVISIERWNPFKSYYHYGIYSGNNNVIHYISDSDDDTTTPYIAETSIERFLHNQPLGDVDVKFFPESKKVLDVILKKKASNLDSYKQLVEIFADYHFYSDRETLRRARNALNGESWTGYRLTTKNCEHFAIWCKTNVQFSSQVFDSPIGAVFAEILFT